MSKDDWVGILIIIGIVAVALFGGSGALTGPVSNSNTNTPPPQTQEQQNQNIAQQIREAEIQVKDLEKQIKLAQEAKVNSQYKDIVDLVYVNSSTDVSGEYISIRVSSIASTSIPVTGWTIKSLNSGTSVTIPKATYLYYSGTVNTEENIYLQKNDTLYLVSGYSPVGASFKVNKCSGYLSQFQTFNPYLYSSCPRPRDENLSSIPKTTINDACLDYIETYPRCKVQTAPLPQNWSSECRNFIYNTINYPSCVNTHRYDADFYQNEWRVYLKRNSPLWKSTRENLVLYDNLGKIVDTLTY